MMVLLVLAAPTVGPWELMSVAIYGGGLVAVLVISAFYNLWPISSVKWLLRRFDHSAIYLLIAGTYTPIHHADEERDHGHRPVGRSLDGLRGRDDPEAVPAGPV